MENDSSRLNDNDVETEGTNTVFDNDDLDDEVAAADDTGMVRGQQYAIKSEENEALDS